MSPKMILALLGLVLAGGTGTGDLLGQPAESKLEKRVRGSTPMPRSLPSTDPTMPPVFVAADRVLQSDGSVDASMFRPGQVGTIQQHLDKEPSNDGCIRLDMMSSEHLPQNGGRPPIAEVISRSGNAVVAEVTGRIYGYTGSVPGTLLRVETQEVLRGWANRESSFIHFPEGSFEVGDRRICYTTLGFPSPPEIGDRVLLLYDDIEFSTRTEVLNVRATDVVVLPQSGAVRFSSYLTSEFAKSSPVGSDHFLDFARAQLAQESHPER